MPCIYSNCVVKACWTALFLAALAVRVALGELGEYVLTGVLVLATSLAFAVSWKCPVRPRVSDVVPPDQLSDSNERREVDAAGGQQTAAAAAPGPNRLPFLDNLRTFLTSLVVTHHVACAFGGCGDGGWYLIAGDGGPPSFTALLRTLTLLDQSYFMSLFFFVSAYFVEPSYVRRGWRGFRKARCKRILLPALFVTFVVSPCAIVIAGTNVYFPNPGPAWFLYWLLLFDLVYVSFVGCGSPPASLSDSSQAIDGGIALSVGYGSHASHTGEIATPNNNGSEDGGFTSAAMVEALVSNEPENPTAGAKGEPNMEETQSSSHLLPSTCRRISLGIGLCGLGMMPLLVLVQGTFASMPAATGSLLCDFLMFAGGLRARRGGWLERPLAAQMDIPPFVLAVMVLVEGAVLMATGLLVENMEELGLILVLAAGMFCLDMSLLVLLVFQRRMDFETRVTRILARGAYGVYLLHPIVVTGCTALFLRVFGTRSNGDESGGESSDLDPLVELARDNAPMGGLYPIGFLVVNVASHLINWPIAYFLAQMPYLKGIL